MRTFGATGSFLNFCTCCDLCTYIITPLFTKKRHKEYYFAKTHFFANLLINFFRENDIDMPMPRPTLHMWLAFNPLETIEHMFCVSKAKPTVIRWKLCH